MNWIKRLFNWKKAPKAINEMKPVEIDKYLFCIKNYSAIETVQIIKNYIRYSYNLVKTKWHKSPKNYFIWLVNNNRLELRKESVPNETDKLIGNLYALYQQYYGSKVQ